MNKYKTEWCEDCKADIVECPACGNTCHYGSTGKIKILSTWYYDEVNNEYFYDKEDCTFCKETYEYQKQIAPHLEKSYCRVFMNNTWVGNSNSNHTGFSNYHEQLNDQ